MGVSGIKILEHPMLEIQFVWEFVVYYSHRNIRFVDIETSDVGVLSAQLLDLWGEYLYPSTLISSQPFLIFI